MIYWKLLICIVVNVPLFGCSHSFSMEKVAHVCYSMHKCVAFVTEDVQTRILFTSFCSSLVQHFTVHAFHILRMFIHISIHFFIGYFEFPCADAILFIFCFLFRSFWWCAPDSIECHVPLCVMPKSKNHVLFPKYRTFFA